MTTDERLNALEARIQELEELAPDDCGHPSDDGVIEMTALYAGLEARIQALEENGVFVEAAAVDGQERGSVAFEHIRRLEARIEAVEVRPVTGTPGADSKMLSVSYATLYHAYTVVDRYVQGGRADDQTLKTRMELFKILHG